MTCKSDGCKAEVAFKTTDKKPGRVGSMVGQPPPFPNNPAISRIFSKYCVKHTCDFFYDVEGCVYKRPHFDSVCAGHAQCPVPGCAECKGQFRDPQHDPNLGIKYLRHAFCPSHLCSFPRCEARRLQVHPGAPYLPFCSQHRCAAENCKKARQEQRNFCLDHKCKDGDCQTVAEDNYELCSIHIVCEVRSCSKARHIFPKGKEVAAKDIQSYGVEEYGNKQYLPYCWEHGACETDGCTGFGTPTSRHCPRHTCPERDCKISTGNHHFCDIHRCDALNCESPKAWKKSLKDREKLCPLHTCRKKDCQGEVASMHLFCAKHECSAPACMCDIVAEAMCITHLRSWYRDDGKAQAKAEIEGWTKLSSRAEEPAPSVVNPFSARVDDDTQSRERKSRPT